MAFFTPRLLARLNNSSPRLGEIISDMAGTIINVGPTSGTPNTNLVVPHGLTDFTGSGATLAYAHVVSGNIYIVSFDATNVTVASTAATQSGKVRLVRMASDGYAGSRR